MFKKVQPILMSPKVRELVHFQYKHFSRQMTETEKQWLLVPFLDGDQLIIWKSDPKPGLTLGLVVGCFIETSFMFIKKQKVRISVVQANYELTETTTILSEDIGFPRSATDIKWSMLFNVKAMAMHAAAMHSLMNS